MPYVKVWIHLVWSTKNRGRLLTDEIRPIVFQHIRENAKEKKHLSRFHKRILGTRPLSYIVRNRANDFGSRQTDQRRVITLDQSKCTYKDEVLLAT